VCKLALHIKEKKNLNKKGRKLRGLTEKRVSSSMATVKRPEREQEFHFVFEGSECEFQRVF
jgi:hypothetical protein